MKKSGLPRYVIQDEHRDGRARLRYRCPGKPSIELPTPFGSDAFWKAYAAAVAGSPIAAAGKEPRRAKAADGTMQALVEAYYRLAPDYVAGDKLTQIDKKGILDGILIEQLAENNPLLFSTCPVTSFTSRHVVALRDRKATTPSAARKRLSYLNLLFEWAKETGRATVNPAEGVKKIAVPRKGFHAWTVEEVRQYEAKHEIGTKARLAFALMAFTGIRISDLRQVGRQHISDGWLALPQHKNRKRSPKMIRVPILPELQTVIDRSQTGDLTFLVRRNGKAFEIKHLGDQFKKWCIEAKLDHCSAHGVRKAGATVAAENGATEAQLMAIFGWEDAQQAVGYTRSMKRRKLAGDAMHLLIPKDAQ